jgi:hypothetical protein
MRLISINKTEGYMSQAAQCYPERSKNSSFESEMPRNADEADNDGAQHMPEPAKESYQHGLADSTAGSPMTMKGI